MDRSNPDVFARNVRAFRKLREMSLNELSIRAGVSKRTLIRIEKGQGCTLRIEVLLAQALSTPSRRLWDPEIISRASQKVISTTTGRWAFFERTDAKNYFRRLEQLGGNDSSEEFCLDPDAIQDDNERNRLGSLGLAHGFSRPVGGSISCGYFSMGFMEFYKDVNMIHPVKSLPYMYYLLNGELEYRREGLSQVLGKGEGIVCHPNAPYVLAPLMSVKRGEYPPTVLFTVQHLFPIDRVKSAL